MPLETDYLDHELGIRSFGKMPPYCPHCGYNLKGTPSNRCPECGKHFPARVIRRYTEKLRYQVKELEDANEMAKWAITVAAASLVIFLLGFLVARGGAFEVFGRVVAAIGGITGFFLGFGVFRVSRIPSWVVEEMEVEPRYGRAAAAVGLSLAALAAALLLG